MRTAVALALVLLSSACREDHSAQGQGSDRPAECVAIVMKVRALIAQNLVQVGSDTVRTIEKMVPVMQRSCEHDGWPAEVKQCILVAPTGDPAALDRCSKLMPKPLQDRLQREMMAAGSGA